MYGQAHVWGHVRAGPHICNGRVKGDIFYLLENVTFHFVIQGWNGSLGDVRFLAKAPLQLRFLFSVRKTDGMVKV